MAQLTPQDVLKLARLAKLQLSEEELLQFPKELSAILAYVEQLAKADTKDLKPTTQVTGLTNVMRPDEIVEYQAKPSELLKNSPSSEKHQIKVKRVLG